MRLTNVSVRNFRAIRELDIDFGPGLTVLHGVNAGGKTSLLAAIANGLRPVQEGYEKYQNLMFRPQTMTGFDISKDQEQGFVKVIFEDDSYSTMEFSRSDDSIFENPRRSVSNYYMNSKQRFPVFVFYGTDRGYIKSPSEEIKIDRKFEPHRALDNSLEGKVDFETTFEWFFQKQHEELLLQKLRQDFEITLGDLEAVRRAISGVIDGASEPIIELNPPRFVVSLDLQNGEKERLTLTELSGGYRTMLALVADLARRMAQANPSLEDPLQSEAIVLIDEIDLHLHPAWQQRVLQDLQRVFPNTQFIVSTHSPQVLSTVKPHQIIHLGRRDGEIYAASASSATFGAESGSILYVEMGVSERPLNEFSEKLSEYMNLIDKGLGETPEAKQLRSRLDELSPYDTGLDRADIAIKRRKIMKSMQEKA
jgi:predicted ATP-binding protein involved in virulence